MMTLPIALTTHDDRTLEPRPDRFGAFLDHLSTNRCAPANEARINASGTTAIMFGAFCLLPRQRLLLEASQPVHLGSRALDILIALVERHGELVTKKELISRVWPGIAVDETNVAVHISALRRTLHDGQAGSRYLINIPRQGYMLCRANFDHRGAAAHVVLGPGDGRRFRRAGDAHATDRKRRRNQEVSGGAAPGFRFGRVAARRTGSDTPALRY